MRYRTPLLLAATMLLLAVANASRADACVICKIYVDCTLYGQDCVVVEYCGFIRAPGGGASDCIYDSYGNCYEVGVCQVTQLRPPMLAAPRRLGPWGPLSCQASQG